ncbi:rubrerythrin family protein [Niabella ginsenosidivorans]|uniref:Rubrerythrin family protein n=1 Tax=Niabella ginsenosidivorans TaxID=1176587 RepID=A0A1A9I5R6_9BACT|nr:ferritin-like domain-containing protein [Niabella ginsenosidivorans]ANH81894.1 rubrerythrin family protein [Niabella ginsenosidivorans]
MTQTKPGRSMTSEKNATGSSAKITPEMKNSEFHRFFVDELKDIYWAEQHLAKALPKMQKASSSKDLAAAFEKHTKETEMHATTLEKVFELLEEKAAAKKCDAMKGLLEEADTIISDTESESFTRDAGLILAAQKVEHYEIATYGTLCAFARQMGHSEAAKLLQQTLDNEKNTDATLTKIAESFVNEEAVAE